EELGLTPTDAPALNEACGRFCMARPTKYDVMLGSRKIAGAAQRKTKEGYLHQGTIALRMPSDAVLGELLKDGVDVAKAMLAHTQPLLEGPVIEIDVKNARKLLKEVLKSQLQNSTPLKNR